MHRRAVLAAVTAGLASLAGCGTAGRRPAGTPTLTPAPVTEEGGSRDGTARRIPGAIDEAVTALGRAIGAFEGGARSFQEIPTVYAYDSHAVSSALERASNALDRAQDRADSPGERDGIATLLTYRDGIEGLANAYDAVLELHRDHTTARSHAEAGDFEVALGVLWGTWDVLVAGAEATGSVRRALETVRADSTRPDALRVGRLAHLFRDLSDVLSGFEVLVSGDIEYTTAEREYVDGRAAFDRGEYRAAIAPLTTAIDHFDAAHVVYGDGQDRTSVPLWSRVTERACRAEHAREAATRLREAAGHAVDGESDLANEDRAAAAEAMGAPCYPSQPWPMGDVDHRRGR